MFERPRADDVSVTPRFLLVDVVAGAVCVDGVVVPGVDVGGDFGNWKEMSVGESTWGMPSVVTWSGTAPEIKLLLASSLEDPSLFSSDFLIINPILRDAFDENEVDIDPDLLLAITGSLVVWDVSGVESFGTCCRFCDDFSMASWIFRLMSILLATK